MKSFNNLICLLLTLIMIIGLSACKDEKIPDTGNTGSDITEQMDSFDDEPSDGTDEDQKTDKTDETDVGDDTDTSESKPDSTKGVSVLGKVTGKNIGQDYYCLSPSVNHPGVVGMDATYAMLAKDKTGLIVSADDVELFCENKDVKISGLNVTVPYSVRASGKTLVVSMKNKKYPERTGKYEFTFVKFSKNATFYDAFDKLDDAVWDLERGGGTQHNETVSQDGKLIFRFTKDGSTNVIETKDFSQSYGCFSASMKMADKGNCNAAFWLSTKKNEVYLKNPQSPGESGGEIDVVEYFPQWGERYAGTLHWNGWAQYHQSSGDENLYVSSPSEQYHTYSVVWMPTAIYWYLDGGLTRVYQGAGVGKNAGAMRVLLSAQPYTEDFWGSTYNPEDFPYEVSYDWVSAYSWENN